MTDIEAGPTAIRHFNVELVEEAPQVKKAPPPRASWEQGKSVGEAVGSPTAPLPGGHSKAYLAGFHNEDREDREEAAADPAGASPLAGPSAGPPASDEALREEIILALRDIYDPEIPVNIYDLGLIYEIHIDDGHIDVTMTLTTPNCPVAESMPGEVELRVLAVPGVATCDVNLVWDPPWNPSHMTDEAKLELGML